MEVLEGYHGSKKFDLNSLGLPIFLDLNFAALANGSYASMADSSGNGRTFTPFGAASFNIVQGVGIRGIQFDGVLTLRNTDKPGFKALHDGTTVSYFYYIELQIGNVANPDTVYGIFGNNGSSGSSVGVCGFWDSRSSLNTAGLPYPANGGTPRKNGFAFQITKGSAPAPIGEYMHDVITPNEPHALTQFMSMFQKQDNEPYQFNNALMAVDAMPMHLQNAKSTAYSTANPTYDFEIGGVGNGAIKMVGIMSRFAIIGSTAITSSRLRTLVSRRGFYRQTKAKTIIDPVIHYTDPGLVGNGYSLGGNVIMNPITGVTVAMYTRSPNHFKVNSDITFYTRRSTDRGVNYGAETAHFFNTSESQIGLFPCWYDETGRLHMLTVEFTNAHVHLGIFQRYSDNDGLTWSAKTSIPMPPNQNTYRIHDQMIRCSDGSLIFHYYGFTTFTSLTNGVFVGGTDYVYSVRSTDGGATWTFNPVYSGATYYNEGSVIELDNTGKLLLAVRDESSYTSHRIFTSSNYGVTWTAHGSLTLDGSGDLFLHPPMLRKIQINGVDVIAYYFTNRRQHRMKVMYARASDLIANPITAWTGKNRYVIRVPRTREVSGYDYLIHPDNNLFAFGMGFDENGTTGTDGISTDTCRLLFYEVRPLHQESVTLELGL